VALIVTLDLRLWSAEAMPLLFTMAGGMEGKAG
jgi:hypothetical protein